MQYLPYTEIQQVPQFLAIDCHHPKGLALSHWKGAPTPAALMDDTSAAIVLNAIEKAHPYLNCPHATNNHFDVDGFLGVWSVLNPKLALEHNALIREMALLGDFRELDVNSPHFPYGLKLVCWLNTVEKTKFYPPFGADELESTEAKLCTEKYRYFLSVFADVLQNPDRYRAEWEEEYNVVMSDLELLQSSQSSVRHYPGIRLMVVETPRPLHYYALFSQSNSADMMLSIYKGQQYELEYKYTTWIDNKRKSFPRLDMSSLVNQLNHLEKSGFQWHAEKISDTGPIMRLQKTKLNKKQRYDHPSNRPFEASSIDEEELENLVVGFYQKHLANIEPKLNWTWAEQRAINDLIFMDDRYL